MVDLKDKQQHNPGQQDYEQKVANHPKSGEDASLTNDEASRFNDIVDNYDKTATGPEVPQAEQDVASRSPGFRYSRGDGKSSPSTSGDEERGGFGGFLDRAKKNKKALGGLGLGIAGILIAGFVALIPAKLETIIKNITNQAAQVPEHIIENRLQYLTAYYLANKMGAQFLDGESKDIAKGNNVAAILFLNWRAAKYEDMLGLKIESVDRDGRGRATKWKLTAKDQSTLELDGNTNDIYREIQGNRQMREYLNREIKNSTKWRNVYKRYAMRKVLMNKFGVRSWRGPAKVENALDKYAEKKKAAKRKIQKKMVQVTIGRIKPHYGNYLSCLIEGGESCDRLRDPNYSTDVEPATAERDPPSDEELKQQARDELGADASDEDVQARADELRADYDATSGALDGSANADLDGIADDLIDGEGDTGAQASKLLTKEIIKKIALGGAAGLGIIEMMSNLVDGVNEGRVNQINYAMNSEAYAGVAAEWQSTNDKFKAGDLDVANMGATMDLLRRIEDSPLEQQELGSLRGTNTPVYRDCDDNGTKEKLPEGDYVCDEKKVGRDITEIITQDPYKKYWDGISKVNDYYKSSVGKVVDFFSDVVGGITDALGIGKLTEWLVDITGLGDLVGKLVNWVMGLLFVPAVNGLEIAGDAYDAISAGLRVSYNGLFEAGTDAEGKASGGGGRHLTDKEVVVLQQTIYQQQHEEFMQNSFYARIFNPHLQGSLMEGLILRAPTDLAGILGSPIASMANIMTPRAMAASSTVVNPFSVMSAGYSDNDGYVDASPDKYTPEFCEKSKKDRDGSYTRDAIPGNGTEKDTPVPVPTKSDPCALEKMVVNVGGAMFTDDASEDYALGGELGNQAATGNEGDPAAAGSFQWPLAANVLSGVTITNCWRSSSSGSGHTGLDFAVPTGTPVKAANSGKVVQAGPGGAAGNVVMIKHSDGHWTNYQHLSKINVKKGDNVVVGDVIGDSGNTGNSTGPHLHFSITTAETLSSRNNTAGSINPLPFMPKTGGQK